MEVQQTQPNLEDSDILRKLISAVNCCGKNGGRPHQNQGVRNSAQNSAMTLKMAATLLVALGIIRESDKSVSTNDIPIMEDTELPSVVATQEASGGNLELSLDATPREGEPPVVNTDGLGEKYTYRDLVFDKKGSVHLQGGGTGKSNKNLPTNYASYRKVVFTNGGSIMTKVVINGQEVNALVDHGAQRTLISQSFWSSLKIKPNLLEANTVGGLIDGQPSIKVFESESVDLLFGQRHYDWKPLVGPFKEDVVLGLDFLVTYGVDTKFDKRVLTIEGEEIPFRIEGAQMAYEQESTKPCYVRKIFARRNVTIPPFTTRIVEIPLKKRLENDHIFEPLESDVLQIGSSMVHVGEKVPVMIMNNSEKNMKIKKGQALGTISEIDTVEYQCYQKCDTSTSSTILGTTAPSRDVYTDSPKAEFFPENTASQFSELRFSEAEIGADSRNDKTGCLLADPSHKIVIAYGRSVCSDCMKLKNKQHFGPSKNARRVDIDFSNDDWKKSFAFSVRRNSVKMEKQSKNEFQQYENVASETENFEKLQENLPENVTAWFTKMSEKLTFGGASKLSETLHDLFGVENVEININGTNFDTSHISNTVPATKSESFEKVVEAMPEHLRDLFKRSSANIDFFQSLKVAKLLSDFEDVFSKTWCDLGKMTDVKPCKIEVEGTYPVRQKVRPTPIHFREEEEKLFNKMFDLGVIEESESEWASPVHLVRKKVANPGASSPGTSLRYTIDFRILNKFTKKMSWPIPRIEDTIDVLQGNRFFSSLDLSSGYWQFPLEESSKHLTAFTSRFGLHQFTVMPYGITNAPAVFQFAMQRVLADLLYKAVLCYLDDVLCLGMTFEEHLSNLIQVFLRFRLHNLKMRPDKCELLQEKLLFLGWEVSEKGIAVNPKNVEVIKLWPVPKNVKDLQKFCGFMNYHRRMLENFAEYSGPLYKLIAQTKKGNLNWENVHQQAFEKLRNLLMEAPIMPYPDPEHIFVLDTDASGTAIACSLQQLVFGDLKIIAFGSYILTPQQKNYCACKRELLSVVRFTRQFRHYLLGRRFILRTDNSALMWLFGFKFLENIIGKYLEELSQFDIYLVHRSGNHHINADTLTRLNEGSKCSEYRHDITPKDLPCFDKTNNKVCKHCAKLHGEWARFHADVEDVVPLSVRSLTVDENAVKPDTAPIQVPGYSTEELKAKQENDRHISIVLDWLIHNAEPSAAELALSSPSVKHYWAMRQQLRLVEGVLYFYWEDLFEPRFLLVIPESLIEEALALCHDNSMAGHYGPYYTYLNVKRLFYWHNRRQKCFWYANTCKKCNENKNSNRHRKAPMHVYHSGTPNNRVHIDVLGPFTKSPSGSLAILCIVDSFTKWTELLVLKNLEAVSLARPFVNEYCSRFGFPGEIMTDQGTNISKNLWTLICELTQIAKTRTTAFHPASNGMVERINRVTLALMRTLRQDDIKEWDTFIPHIASAIRSATNRTTGFTANMMMLGREVNKPADLVFGLDRVNLVVLQPYEYVVKLEKILEIVHTVARETIGPNQQVNKKGHDRKLNFEYYGVGDLVYEKNDHNPPDGISAKLLPRFLGPYVVSGVLMSCLYVTRTRETNGKDMVKIIHHNRLEPCRTRESQIPRCLKILRNEILSPDYVEQVTVNQTGDPILDINKLYREGPRKEKSAAPVGGQENQARETEAVFELPVLLEEDDMDILNNPEIERNPVVAAQDAELIYVSNDNPRVSTRGRVMRPSWRLKDYIMDVDSLDL